MITTLPIKSETKQKPDMPTYFTLKELCYSTVAEQNGIDNFPSFEIVENLKYTTRVLDDFRQYWGRPIRVTSGYRCAALNKKVGGVSNSSHKLGLAVDCQPLSMDDWEEFKIAATLFFQSYDGDFDQIITEKNKTTEWLHIGVAGDRRQIFSLDV